jgi:glycosyltransferase involved in cell wall biosynthesis
MNISVIIPSYNQGKFIETAIKSILGQKYDQTEIIVVDNESTDETRELLKKYSSKIKAIIEKDKGQTNAINKGFKLAKGDILAYLNADDVYEPIAFRYVVNFFKKNPQAKIVYGKGKFIDEKGKFLGYYKTNTPSLENLFKECVISQPTVFMRREVYDNVGLFDEGLNYTMDYDYWIRVAKKYEFYFIDEVLASTRLHNNTKTATAQEKIFFEILTVLKKNYGKVSDEAVFNYAYVKGKNNFEKIKEALKIYFKYRQFPTKTGLKHFGILLKKLILFQKSG